MAKEMTTDTVLLYYSDELCGCFASRGEAEEWIRDLQKDANVPTRVTGEWGSYGPILREEFRIVCAAKPTNRKRAEIMKGAWGGWESDKTRKFLLDGLREVKRQREKLNA